MQTSCSLLCAPLQCGSSAAAHPASTFQLKEPLPGPQWIALSSSWALIRSTCHCIPEIALHTSHSHLAITMPLVAPGLSIIGVAPTQALTVSLPLLASKAVLPMSPADVGPCRFVRLCSADLRCVSCTSACRAMQAFEAYVKETEWGQVVASQHFKAHHQKQRTASASQSEGPSPRSGPPKQAHHISGPGLHQHKAGDLQLAASLPPKGRHEQAAVHQGRSGGTAHPGHARRPQRSRLSRADDQQVNGQQEQALQALPENDTACQPSLAGPATGAQHGHQLQSRKGDDDSREQGSEAGDEQGSQMDAAVSDDDLASSLQHKTSADRQPSGGQPLTVPPFPTPPAPLAVVGFSRAKSGRLIGAREYACLGFCHCFHIFPVEWDQGSKVPSTH